MAFVGFLRVCCGAFEEEDKDRAFEPTSARTSASDWDRDANERHDSEAERVRRLEEKVTIANRCRRIERPCIRGTIACKPMDMNLYCSKHQPPRFPKEPADFDFLRQVVREGLMTTLDLEDSEIELLCTAMQKETVSPNTTIISKGDVGDFYYVVDQGEILFIEPDEDNKIRGRATRGGTFGELALLYDSPRDTSCVTADQPATLWKVDQLTFRYLLAQHSQNEAEPLKHIIRQIDIFKGLEDSVVTKFVQGMTRIRWKEGDRIAVKGEEGTIFHIIEAGQVHIHDIGLGDSTFEDQILGVGDSFGERSLLTGEPREANATALTDVVTRAIDRETFEKSIGPLKAVLERNIRRQYLASMPIFSQLAPVEIDQLVDRMVEVCYCKNQKLAEAGKPYEPFLWIIRHGRLLVFSTKVPGLIYNLKSGDYFGDKSIRYPGRISSHNAVCEEDLTAWILSSDDIESVIYDIERLGEPSTFSVAQQRSALRLEDLTKLRILGQGAFGRVWLVRAKEEGKTDLFALKVISKRLIVDAQQVQGVIREKQLLSLLHHKFILYLVGSFQDARNLYLLLPVIPGGELYSVMERRKSRSAGLPEKSAAFYVACILEALIHFHHRSVAYRDLKLENVLLDNDGYCCIVDLGFAKVVTDKTYTLVGTPEYLAPEVIMSKGYDKACDLWSYGVLTYELIVGKSPFFGPGSRMDMFKRIVQGKYDCPRNLTDNAKDLIHNLLLRRPTDRLGNRALGHSEIRRHPWFKDSEISFKTIMSKTCVPPWKPQIKDPFSLSSFDDYSHLEKEIDHSRPLSEEEQALFNDF